MVLFKFMLTCQSLCTRKGATIEGWLWCGCKQPQMKADSRRLNRKASVTFQIKCDAVKSQNQKKGSDCPNTFWLHCNINITVKIVSVQFKRTHTDACIIPDPSLLYVNCEWISHFIWHYTKLTSESEYEQKDDRGTVAMQQHELKIFNLLNSKSFKHNV